MLDEPLDEQLMSLVVWGTLRVEDRGPRHVVNLRAVCIHIMGGGKLVAGAPHAPFSGALSLLLTGDEITESPQCGGLKGRSLDVDAGGELLLHGKPTHHNLRPLPMKLPVPRLQSHPAPRLQGPDPHWRILSMNLIASESGHGLHIYAVRSSNHLGTWASFLEVGGASGLPKTPTSQTS